MDKIEIAINHLIRKLGDNHKDREALEVMCEALRKSTNTSDNSGYEKSCDNCKNKGKCRFKGVVCKYYIYHDFS